VKTTGLTIALLFSFGTLAFAGTITVDGDLADWGVSVDDSTTSTPASNITGYAGHSGIGLLGWMCEDTDDTSNSYYVGPNYGGQNYDAEFLGVASYGGDLYLAIVSGQRPDNGADKYAPGDIRIVTSGGVFGIEVGGGLYDSDDGSYIVAGALGTTYGLTDSGYTKSVDTAITQLAGSVWKDATWYTDPIFPGVETQQISGGTHVGTANYHFTRNSWFTSSESWGGQHSIIELSVSLSTFGAQNTITDIYWRPSCGNDELHVELPNIPTNIVPLPGAIGPGLVVLALLGVARSIRRRRVLR